jgi:hypothetical protein
MNRKIASVVTIKSLKQQGNDFAYWQSQPYQERLRVLEEIRSDYLRWRLFTKKEPDDFQPGFQRVYHIVKRK